MTTTAAEHGLTLQSPEQAWHDAAWSSLQDNLAQNESELEELVLDYEDDTGREIDLPAGCNRIERGIELKDPAFEAWVRARMSARGEQLLASYRSMVGADGTIRCWRAIDAHRTWSPTGSQGIGVHWSSNRESAVPHFGGHDGPGWVTHVVEADVPPQAVDWDATVSANLSGEFGEEDEVRLTEQADAQGAVRIAAVYVADSPEDRSRQQGMTQTHGSRSDPKTGDGTADPRR